MYKQRQILELVKKNDGIKARKIARLLGLEKAAVNGFLSGNQALFRKDDDCGWHYIGVRDEDQPKYLPGTIFAV